MDLVRKMSDKRASFLSEVFYQKFCIKSFLSKISKEDPRDLIVRISMANLMLNFRLN